MTTEAAAAAEIPQLVSLRLAVEDACRQTRTAGRFRRAAAIVALDGVVERTCWLVAVSLGKSVKTNTKIEDLISQLREGLDGTWAPTVLPTIRQLHRARNAAQHEGLEPDRDLLPQWLAAAEGFVTSLIGAAFAVDIRTVVLADAIENAEWADQFRDAESALAEDDFGACVRLGFQAQQCALAAWDHLSGRPQRGSLGPFDPLRKELGPVSNALDSLEAMIRSQAFAGSASDAAWFADVARAEPEHITRAEAERALRYAFDWVTGYELAASDWRADRAWQANVAARATRAGVGPARIGGVVSVETGRLGWITLTLRCVDVPAEGEYEEWRSTLQTILTPSQSYPQPWTVHYDGSIERCFVAQAPDVEADLAKLTDALQQTEMEIALRHQTRESTETAEVQARSQRLADFAQQATPAWVASVDWGLDTTPGGATSGFWFLKVTQAASRLVFPSEAADVGRRTGVAELLRAHTLVDQITVGGRRGWQLSPDLSATQLAEVLRDVDVAVAAKVAEENQKRIAVATKRASIRARAEQFLALPPENSSCPSAEREGL